MLFCIDRVMKSTGTVRSITGRIMVTKKATTATKRDTGMKKNMEIIRILLFFRKLLAYKLKKFFQIIVDYLFIILK